MMFLKRISWNHIKINSFSFAQRIMAGLAIKKSVGDNLCEQEMEQFLSLLMFYLSMFYVDRY